MRVTYEAKLEGLLFVAGSKGVTLNELAQGLGVQASACLQQLEKLKEKYETDSQRGLTILAVGDIYKLVTKRCLNKTLENYAQSPGASRLSQAAIETLAIIAYRQPISRSEVDEIRGVQSHGAVQTLVLKRLIEEKGRFDGPGRAILYGTTKYFLDYFGLENLASLPDLKELDEEDAELPNLFFTKEELEISKSETTKHIGGI